MLLRNSTKIICEVALFLLDILRIGFLEFSISFVDSNMFLVCLWLRVETLYLHESYLLHTVLATVFILRAIYKSGK